MNKYSLVGADCFTVINKNILDDSNHKLLTCFYQPIVGFKALSLYFNLWSMLDKLEIISDSFTHNHIFNMMGISSNNFIDARQALEAVGLLKTYFLKGEVNKYIYEIFSPLEAIEFLNHPILGIALYTKVGKKEFNRIRELYKVPVINLSGYSDITTKFNELYRVGPYRIQSEDCFRSNCKLDLTLDTFFDFDLLKSSLPDSINADNVFVDENKKLIESLAFIYNLDELKMVNILRGSVNQYGVIDKKEFRKIARNNYLIKEGSLPKLLNKCQPLEYVKKDKTGSKKDRMINFFETTTPFNFLKFKNNNSKPTKRDLEIVEELIVDLKLNPGVVNVLLDYVFRINNNKLVKNFVHAIAGQWKRNNIKTVEEAMNIAESEYKKTINNKNRKSKNSDITPKWFDKNINKKNITENDKNKLDTLLKDFN